MRSDWISVPDTGFYFGKDGERLVILLAGGTIRRQQADVEAAQSHWRLSKRDERRDSAMKTGPRPFSDSLRDDMRASSEFRRGIPAEAFAEMASGAFGSGKIMLRECIHGTIGFTAPGAALERSPKSLMRMLGPQRNPQTRDLFQIFAYLQKMEGIVLEVRFSSGEARAAA
ncbi:hypothetical protein [Granulicella pectinivorans]|nr:hypothetical protein [Granulicella pectinivorans]